MISRNGKRIIAHFIHHAETTIPEIAAAMELSIGTATKEIIALQEDAYVVNNGKMATGSGRKPSSFSLNPNSYYYAGIDLNDKFINYAIMDLSGNLVSTGAPAEFKLENTPESLRRVCDFIRELRSRNAGEQRQKRQPMSAFPAGSTPEPDAVTPISISRSARCRKFSPNAWAVRSASATIPAP